MFLRNLVLLAFLPVLIRSPLPAFDVEVHRAALATIAGDTAAARRRSVAERFAPTLFQEVINPVRDRITRFDFDGDWDGRNNSAHVTSFPMPAVLYYTVLETVTHWFVHYLPYHPVDYKRVGGHSHDTESILMIVRKEGGGARLELMETRFHKVWYQYAPEGSGISSEGTADDVDGFVHFDEAGHPAVYAQRAGHGLCGGLAQLSPLRELELSCDHRVAPRIVERGVIYRHPDHEGLPGTSTAPAVESRDYSLVEISSSLWAHRRDPETVSDAIDYEGERCEKAGWRCPHAIGRVFAVTESEGDSAEAPWGQTPGAGSEVLGDQFFDPARTLNRRLRFSQPFSLEYQFNPYLGIGPLPSS